VAGIDDWHLVKYKHILHRTVDLSEKPDEKIIDDPASQRNAAVGLVNVNAGDPNRCTD